MDTVAQPYTAALAESKVNTELSGVQCPNYATLGICRSTHETIWCITCMAVLQYYFTHNFSPSYIVAVFDIDIIIIIIL